MSQLPTSAKDLFLAALDIEPAQRAAFLDEACAGNAPLQRQIEALLRVHDEPDSLLDRPRIDLGLSRDAGVNSEATVDEPPITEKPGTVIGPYKLLQQIGEGGFGIVYMADQIEPVKRRVALKIIKPGMDTRQVIARFEVERQALAMMDHPNIAKVLDAGTTASGRPYFVMELVKGLPITQFSDQQHLTPRQRLELFVPVCQALQHAHQKGIIHRDIKPSNVLVAKYDDQPVPKVIDFGVVKAIEQQLTEKTMFTQFGQIMGTVDYMSPEQAELNQLDIDTRSDIYSLGVLLYELLTGEMPFDRQRLRSAAFDELLRIIREEEPPKPSLRLSTSESLPSIAANRQIEPKKLSTLVHGELDWIVMKALEKDRTRRYATANEFANDIRRYLNGEPVVACPPSAAYRFRKFAGRNKTAIVTASLVVAALVVGIVGTTWQSIRATKQRNRAVTAERIATDRLARAVTAEKRAQDEAEKAKTEAAITQAVNDFVKEDLLAQADPGNEPDRDIKLRTVVDRAAEKVEGRFVDHPLVEAAIRTTLGSTYQSLGQYERAHQHSKWALETRRRVLGQQHPQTLVSMDILANLYHHQGRYEQAEPLYEKILEICRRVLGPRHPGTLTSMNNLAGLYRAQGRHEQAEPLQQKALEIQRRVLGEAHPDTLSSMNNLALLYMAQGRYKDAQPLYEKTREICRRVLGQQHPNTLSSMNNLAELYKAQGRYEEAEPLYEKTLKIRRRVLGEQHPHTLTSMNNLAMLYMAQGRYKEAKPLHEKVLEIRRRVLGQQHPAMLQSMNNLAHLYQAQGRYEQAEPLYQKALEICRRVLGQQHPRTLTSMNNLAMLYMAQGRYKEAEPLHEKALEIRRRVLGQQHPETLSSMNNLAELYRAQGHYKKAESLMLKLVAMWRQHSDTLDPSAAWLTLLGSCLLDQNKYSEAELILRETLAIREKRLPDDWRRFRAMSLLGASLMGQAQALRTTNVQTADEEFAEAEALLVQGYEGMKRREAKIPAHVKDRLTKSLQRVVELYDTWDKAKQASQWRKKVESAEPKKQPAGEPAQPSTTHRPEPEARDARSARRGQTAFSLYHADRRGNSTFSSPKFY